MFFAMKTELPQDGSSRKVKILENKGVQPADQWGNIKHRFEILVDDQTKFTWDASPTAMSNLEEINGDVEGAVFVIKRWDKGGKSGFNYFPEDDINAQPQNCTQPPAQSTPQKHEVASPDVFQQKLSRGASLNLSSYFSIYGACGGKLKISEWFDKVMKDAEELTAKQTAFVNNEEPEVEGETTIDDLPF